MTESGLPLKPYYTEADISAGHMPPPRRTFIHPRRISRYVSDQAMANIPAKRVWQS
jgi:hypothetical protein